MVWFEDQTSVGPFAAVAVAIPAPEARLLVGRVEGMVETLSRVRMQPTWAVMVRLDEQVLPDQDVYSDMSEVLRWIAPQQLQARPDRQRRGTIVIHASPSWSRETEDADPQSVAEELWSEVRRQLNLPDVAPQADGSPSLALRPRRPVARRVVHLFHALQARDLRRLVPRPIG